MALAPSIIINMPGYPWENFPSVASLAALRALPSADFSAGANYVVDGGSAAGDGGGGVFAWNAASIAADDGATVIKPNDKSGGQAGRWIVAGKLATDSAIASATAAKANKDLDNLTAGITGLDANYQGSGKPAILHDASTNFALADAATATDVANITFLRHANYTGGSPGFTNNAIRAISTVEAGVTDFEWTATFIMENYATAGENVGSYSIGRKHSTGPTWGALSEVIEVNAVNNPTSGSVAHELDVSANGTDNVFPYARVGCDLAVRRYDAGGADIEVGWGYRIQNGGYANSLVRIGFGFYTGMKVVDAFDCSRAIVSGAALKMAVGVPISFDAGAQHLLKYTNAVGLEYSAAGVVQTGLHSDGTLYQRPLTVATLPAAGQFGRRAVVSDANATTFNSVVAGGGANKVPVFDDGAAWRIG